MSARCVRRHNGTMTENGFTQPEANYLTSQSLARLATVGVDGQPDVVPVAVEFDGAGFWICGAGEAVLRTRKVRNVVAEPPVKRVGMVGPGYYMRVTPTVSWSWNMEAEPVGEEWYPTRRAVRGPAPRSDP